MGRPRKWADEAARKRATRNGSEAYPESVDDPESPSDPEPLAAASASPEPQGLPEIPKGRPAPALELYLADAREGARIEGERKWDRIGPTESPSDRKARVDDIASRVRKAEEYARWRHAGYVAGEIASL